MAIFRTLVGGIAAVGVGLGLGWAVVKHESQLRSLLAVQRAMPQVVPTVAAATLASDCLADASTRPVPHIADAPLLQVEPGEHIGAIRALAISKSGEIAVTGGWDKTIRLWDLPGADGALVRPILRDTLRVPLGSARTRTGEAYATAISPDANLVAVGGRMADEDAPGGERVYVFATATAAIVKVLRIGSQVSALEFSADGRFLAAGSAAGVGLCTWSTQDWHLAGQDRDYGSRIGGLDFDGQGRLVSTSDDGGIRLYLFDTGAGRYGRRDKFEAVAQSTVGHKPVGVAFSPDGRFVVAGYGDAPFLTLHTASALKTHVRLHAARAESEGLVLPFVSWSNDGRTIFAGGSSLGVEGSPRSKTLVHLWKINPSFSVDALKAALPSAQTVEVAGASGPMQALRSRGASGAALVTRNADIVGLGGAARTTFVRAPTRIDWSVANWRARATDFRVSADTARVAVRLHDGRVVRFDFARRNTDAGSFIGKNAVAADAQLRPPTLGIRGLSVSFDKPFAPKLTGPGAPADAELALDAEVERAVSFAASEAGGAFALGTIHNIRLYDASGEQRGRVAVPEAVHRIAFSANGELVVAAIGDGTLRWYRIERSPNRRAWGVTEILTLYLHNDGRRWIAWTAAGYYDAAPEAEALIGWHVNRGTERSGLFYSSGRFRELYRRQDIVDRALTASRVERAPDPAVFLAKSPPVVRIRTVSQTADLRARVIYDLEWPVQATPIVQEVIGSVDGINTATGRGLERSAPRQAVDLTVPAGTGPRRVAIQARSINSAFSDPAITAVPALRATLATEPKGSLHAVVIGISNYQDRSIAPLEFADDDARVFEELLRKQKGGLYKDVIVNRINGKALIDGTATRANIVKELEALAAGENDVSVLFLAGHGTLQLVRRQLNGKPWSGQVSLFLPYDAKTRDGGVVDGSTLDVSDIARMFLSRGGGRKLVFVDACRSGNFAHNNGTQIAETLKDSRADVAIWSAATASQLALESRSYLGGHGAFTAALIEAFRGDPLFPRRRHDRFREGELSSYLTDRVLELTGNQQEPVRLLSGTDGQIAVIVP